MKLTIESLGSIISGRFRIEQARIVPEATLEELGFDSLSTIDLAVLLEKKAGFKISDAQLGEIAKISDILVVVNGSM